MGKSNVDTEVDELLAQAGITGITAEGRALFAKAIADADSEGEAEGEEAVTEEQAVSKGGLTVGSIGNLLDGVSALMRAAVGKKPKDEDEEQDEDETDEEQDEEDEEGDEEAAIRDLDIDLGNEEEDEDDKEDRKMKKAIQDALAEAGLDDVVDGNDLMKAVLDGAEKAHTEQLDAIAERFEKAFDGVGQALQLIAERLDGVEQTQEAIGQQPQAPQAGQQAIPYTVVEKAVGPSGEGQNVANAEQVLHKSASAAMGGKISAQERRVIEMHVRAGNTAPVQDLINRVMSLE